MPGERCDCSDKDAALELLQTAMEAAEETRDYLRTIQVQAEDDHPIFGIYERLDSSVRAVREAAGELMQYAGRMTHVQGVSPQDRMKAFAFALGWIATTDDRYCDACEAVGAFLRAGWDEACAGWEEA